MQIKQPVGPGASAVKYDILTGLLTLAAQDAGVQGRLALRLSLIITARYNWRSGSFAIGQRELARMWGVTERTAKREMAQLKVFGWITVQRAAARGRVTEHRINMDALMRATMPYWDAVGPDFHARMTGVPEQAATNVIPLNRATPPADDGSLWAGASAKLFAQDPATHAAWFAPLRALGDDSGDLVLAAPSRFVAEYVQTHFATRLLAAVTSVDRSLRGVRVVAVGEGPKKPY